MPVLLPIPKTDSVHGSNGFSIIDGYLDGQGEVTFRDGVFYRGPIRERKLGNGKGLIRFPNGRQYEGDFVDGQMTGEGKLTIDTNGKIQTYEGNFVAGDIDGHGVLTTSANTYDGNWKVFSCF